MRALLPALIALPVALIASADGNRSTRSPFGSADLAQLNFARVAYESEGGMGEAYYAFDGRLWARWETDFPEGDQNFNKRVAQLTRIHVNTAVTTRRLDAPDLGDFPILYMVDPGWMVLSDEEIAGLRRYLASGGFLWVDDFWGDAEWQQFAEVMRRVMPGREWRVLTPPHPIFSTVYEMQEMPQIPAEPIAYPQGPTAEPAGMHRYPAGSLDEPQMRAWFDDEGRLVVIATHNTDIGDGWEREAYGEFYFENFSTKSYMLGINILAYAMMH